MNLFKNIISSEQRTIKKNWLCIIFMLHVFFMVFPGFLSGAELIFTGSVDYSYDDAARVIKEDHGAGNWVSYGYDEANNLVKIVSRQYPFSVVKAGTGTGRVITEDTLIDCGVDCSEYYSSGTEVTLLAEPESDTGSVFVGWSGGGCSGIGPCVINTTTDSLTITAVFEHERQLTVELDATNYCTGSIISSDGGIDCGADCSETYYQGTEVVLTVIPDGDCQYKKWLASCTWYQCGFEIYAGEATITLGTTDATVTAFIVPPEVPLTLQTSGTGQGSISRSPGSLYCGVDCEDIVYYKGSEITLTATPEEGSYFVGWSGGPCLGNDPVCVYTVSDAASVSAQFDSFNKSITVIKTGNGTGLVESTSGDVNCGSDCTESYNEDTQISLFVLADTGSRFVGWSGSGCSGTGDCDIFVDSDKIVLALFEPEQYLLTVEPFGAGTGSITSAEGLIDCGTICSAAYDPETMVILTASEDPGSVFKGWTGGGCSGTGTCEVRLSTARKVSACFEPFAYTLTIDKQGNGLGSITSTPDGISCGVDCSADFTAADTVRLLAAADPGSVFLGWFGTGCSGTGECVVEIDRAIQVNARFAAFGGNLFVDGVSGSDSDSGSTWEEAKQTIQAAIDAADGLNLFRIHVKEGVYPETLVLRPRIDLMGGYSSILSGTDLSGRNPGEYTTAIDSEWSDQVISIPAPEVPGAVSEDIGIRGFSLLRGAGNGPLAVLAPINGLFFEDNFILENDYGIAWFDSGLCIPSDACNDAENILFRNNTFTGNASGSGIEFYGTTAYIVLEDNTIQEFSGSEIWGGIHFYDIAGNIQVTDNLITGSGLDRYAGIHFWYTVSDFEVSGNTVSFIPTDNNGVTLWGKGTSHGVIKDNVMKGLGSGSGLKFFYDTSDLVIAGNTFDSISGWDGGIQFGDDAMGILIETNNFSNMDTGSKGIHFQSDVSHATLKDNTFDRFHGNGNGVIFWGPASFVTLTGNVFTRFADDTAGNYALESSGIYFYDRIDEARVCENRFEDFQSSLEETSFLGISGYSNRERITGLTIENNQLLNINGYSHDGIVLANAFNSLGTISYPAFGVTIANNILSGVSGKEGMAGIVLDKIMFGSEVRNNIVSQSGTGVDIVHGAGVSVANNTFWANDKGVMDQGGNSRYMNNLVTDSTSHGVTMGKSGAPFLVTHNNVFNNGIDYDGITDLTGSAGNISTDPLFLAPGSGNLYPTAGSPVIDAGTSTGSPELDIQNSSRIDDPSTVDTGSGIFTYYDMGAYEYNPSGTLHHLVIVSREGDGSGRISGNTGGIDCGFSCGAAVDEGSLITLTAQAAIGSVFTGWSGHCSGTGPCIVSVDGPVSAVAMFAAIHPLGEGMDQTSLPWTTGGDHAWTNQSSDGYGGDSAQSGPIGDNQSSWMETTILGPATISFYWKVFSEIDFDTLGFFIDGELQDSISGVVGWQQKSFILDDAPHTLRWEYTKNNTGSAALDMAMVDRLEICNRNYLINPASQFFGFDGGFGAVEVTGPDDGCWFAVSNVPWISIASGSHGSGNDTVAYEVSPGSSRTGTLTIGGRIFTITQESMFDPGFNDPQGLIYFNRGSDQYDYGYAVALQPDGKIVVAGESRNDVTTERSSLIVRFTREGSIDTAFGENGVFVFNGPSSEYDFLNDVVIQPDGRILATGVYHDGSIRGDAGNDLFLLRLLQDGTLDPDFGTSGAVIYNGIPGREDQGRAIALQPDGRILVAGTTHNGISEDALVLRFFSDGTLDPDFGSEGQVAYDGQDNFDDWASSIVVSNQGNIIVAGGSRQKRPINENSYTRDDDVLLLQYTADGMPDPSFGTNGVLFYNTLLNRNEWANSLAIDSDGRIVVAGTGTINGVSDDMMLARFLSDGSLDLTFGSQGTSFYNSPVNGDDFASNLLIQTNGKILISGIVHNGINNDLGVLRFDSNGNLDDSFAGKGVFLFNGRENGSEYRPDILLQPDCKIVVSGSTFNGSDLDDIVIMRLNDSSGCISSADINLDGDVDGADLAEFIMAYHSDRGILPGGEESAADLNKDGVVDTRDIIFFVKDFGMTLHE